MTMLVQLFTDLLNALFKISRVEIVDPFFKFQFRHKSDQQVNNRQSQVLIRGRYLITFFLICMLLMLFV